ncbi:MAG: WD40 repeat domain-containing protein [Magnetococcales bacterium]|nr:WD40 repeat domain-containing protein [Magnetococcales bacterium]MBF0439615.1 WD40 repeat domain-containing protein [Magnetococcales bacterium]
MKNVCRLLQKSHWIGLLLWMGIFALPSVGKSDERIPFTGPLLRVESGMHAGLVRRIAVDEEDRYIFSVSDDKTLKIWSQADGRLLLTLRVPIGLTNEGALYAMDISPDGRTVAVAGQTGPEWENSFCIYLLDVREGKMRRRICNLPEAVNHLAFSATGGYLAAVFGEKAGLRVFGIPEGALVYASEPYQSPSNWVDFAANGRLVTSSYDGAVRLYDENFRLLVTKQVPKPSKPYGVAFSPDGSKIAVGLRDRPAVVVLSGEDLSLSYLPDVAGVKNNLWVVAWSKDGRVLYAGGGHKNKGRNLMRWWSNAGEPNAQGRGDYVDVPASQDTVMQIVPVKEGGVVFAAADSSLGLLDRQGFPLFIKEQSTVSFQGSVRRLLVSEKGDVVDFDYDASGQQRGRFSVSQLLLNASDGNTDGMEIPRLSTETMRVTGFGGSSQLMLNGSPIPLEAREIPLSLDVDYKDRFLILGTSVNLRLYDKNGSLYWKKATPGPVWAVNTSGNGLWVIAAIADGTIRWYSAMRGDERMALYVHKDQKRWAVWSPQNLYGTSVGGETLIGWHLNRGKDQLAEFYPVTQFPQYLQLDYFKNLFQ